MRDPDVPEAMKRLHDSFFGHATREPLGVKSA
jgi:hypothetical protein